MDSLVILTLLRLSIWLQQSFVLTDLVQLMTNINTMDLLLISIWQRRNKERGDKT